MTPWAAEFSPPVPLRMLCLAEREPRWTAFSVRMESAYGGSLRIQWASTLADAIAELRTNCWDTLLLEAAGVGRVALLDAVQTFEGSAATVALLALPDDSLVAELFARDCDVCISPRMWDSPALPAVVLAAIRRRQCRQELQRHSTTHYRRLSREQTDAESLLRLQHELLLNLQSSRDADNSPPDCSESYADLLKATILSGPKRLGPALDNFVQHLAADGRSPADVLAWHIDRVAALSAGMGGRTSQHLLSRADLLVIEVLVRLGEHYRRVASNAARPAA